MRSVGGSAGSGWTRDGRGGPLPACTAPGLISKLEHAITNGQIIVLFALCEELDPMLSPILMRQTEVQGKLETINLPGHENVRVHECFRLVVVCQRPNPIVDPTLLLRLSLVTF